MKSFNLFSNIPGDMPNELFDELIQCKSFKLERIVSKGHATPSGQWYEQDSNEWVLLLRGAAGLLVEGEDEVLVLKPGDHVLLPAHLRHRVEWTKAGEETVWLALHY